MTSISTPGSCDSLPNKGCWHLDWVIAVFIRPIWDLKAQIDNIVWGVFQRDAHLFFVLFGNSVKVLEVQFWEVWPCNVCTVCVDGSHAELMSLSSDVEFLLLSPLQYGIVLDAGSSHTNLYIYQWPAEKDNNTGRVDELHSCSVQGKAKQCA